MGLDLETFVAQNARPATTPGATILPYPLPGGLGNITYFDYEQAVELGRGTPIYAHFRIATTFGGGHADNFLRFGIAISAQTNFLDVLSNKSLIVVRGPDIAHSGLVQNREVCLPIPPPSTLALGAKRYLGLLFEAYVPATDWDSGGIDAFLTDAPIPVGTPDYVSGY